MTSYKIKLDPENNTKECLESSDTDPSQEFDSAGSASLSPFSQEPYTPSYLKWAENLYYLLKDGEGVSLYKEFLIQENCSDLLDFWFACEGLKRQNREDSERLNQLVKVIYRKFIRGNSIHLSEDVKVVINNKMSNKDIADPTIFDTAQRQVEKLMQETTYPNFLKSDLYLHYVQNMMQHGSGSPTQDELSVSNRSNGMLNSMNTILSTVHEDSELTIIPENKTVLLPLTKNALLFTQNQRANYSLDNKNKNSEYTVWNNLSTNPYHARYSTCLPTSRLDSELQSLSSDANTDDTRSVTDNSSVNLYVHNKKNLRRQYSQMKENANLNRTSFGDHIIPRTQRVIKEQNLAEKNPKKFAHVLSQKLEKIKKEQEIRDRLSEKLNEDNKEECHKRTLFGILPVLLDRTFRERFAPTDYNHMSRIWKDSLQQTPARSPGMYSPRPKSPENCRRHVFLFPPNKVTMGVYHSNQQSSRMKDKDVCSQISTDSGNINDYMETVEYKVKNWVGPTDATDRLRNEHNHYDFNRKPIKEGNRKNVIRKSGSDFTDSGISLGSGLVSSKFLTNSKDKLITSVVENGKSVVTDGDKHRGKSVHGVNHSAPVSFRTSHNKKIVPIEYNSIEKGYQPWSLGSQFADVSSCFPSTTNQLEEARRRLEDTIKCKSSKFKYSSIKNRNSHPSCSLLPNSTGFNEDEFTVVTYVYDDESVPYRTKLPGKLVTFKQFKSLLPKKGNYRYYFKTECDDFGPGIIHEEMTDDNDVIPMLEGRIVATIKAVE